MSKYEFVSPNHEKYDKDNVLRKNCVLFCIILKIVNVRVGTTHSDVSITTIFISRLPTKKPNTANYKRINVHSTLSDFFGASS